MRKLIFLVIIFFLGYYSYGHKEEIKLWIAKMFGKAKVTVAEKIPVTIKSNIYKFSITMDKDACLKAEGVDDVNIVLLSIKDKNKVLIMINKQPCILEKNIDIVRFLNSNNKLTLKLLKTYKNKVDISVSLSAVKERTKEIEIVTINKKEE